MAGIDSSPAMLDKAAARGPRRTFEAGDIATWTSAGDHDLVFANASLHWVPDHPAVLARWWAALAPGGQLAVQVPSNADHAVAPRRRRGRRRPSRSCRRWAGSPPSDPVADNVLAPEDYAVLLDDLGAVRQHVRLQVYGHLLDRSSRRRRVGQGHVA